MATSLFWCSNLTVDFVMLQGVRFLVFLTLPFTIVVLVSSSALAVWFDRFAYDLLNQYYASVDYRPKDVVLIDIDQESIDRFSGWPLNRGIHAEVIERLSSAEASSITYNVAFIGEDLDNKLGDKRLVDAIKQSGRVILPLIAENGRELKPLNAAELPKAVMGHADLSLDEDEYLRRSYLYAGMGFPRWPSLALASLHVYAPVKADDFSGLRTPYLHVGFSKLWSRDYELLLPFGLASFEQHVLRYPLWALLDGSVPKDKLRNKAIFVGISAPTIENKLKVLPQNSFFSTEIHAFIFSTLNRGYMLSPSLSVWAVILGILATLCWGLFLAKLPVGWRFAGFCMVFLLAGVPVWLLSLGYWLSMMPMLAGLVSVSCIFTVGRLSGLLLTNKKALD
ncbi:CHASE2 domain-containing protein [Neptuniibacter marinus]|uniref:CHASE2 domain-containing protein n=1 Tax=Neptuniibacter marinus TaxID=1806670 RepID=UPI003B5C2F98